MNDLRLRTLRIIHFALCLGAGNFLVIALFMAPIGEPGAQGPFFAYLGAGLAVPILLAAWLVPLQVDATQRKRARTFGVKVAWDGPYVTRSLVRAAPLEAATFLQIVFYLLDAQPLNLGVGLGTLVLLVLMFP